LEESVIAQWAVVGSFFVQKIYLILQKHVDIGQALCYTLIIKGKEDTPMDNKKPSDLQLAIVAGIVAGLIVEIIKILADLILH
jgi:hypothetical protein